MPEKNSRKGNGSLRTLLKMTDLVIINSNKEAVTSHISIAEGMEVTQDSSLQLIKRYKADLEEFGRVRFQIVPFQTKGGVQKHKEYMKFTHNGVKYTVDDIIANDGQFASCVVS